MDADTTASTSPSASWPPAATTPPTSGGTVEPANRATVAKARFQTPEDPVGERYELRDPFAEVTYRASTQAEMVAKAEQLGSTRFVAIGEDGQRTPVQKVDGAWRRDEPSQARDPAAAKRPAPTPSERDGGPAPVDSKALAAMEAKADRAALVARIEAALLERYVIKRAPVSLGDVSLGGTEYRFRGDTSRVAFTESTFRLATDTNSPSVARSMVDVAEARQWAALRISGHEDFRRMVWLEASVRGVKALGYEPGPADRELLQREREARLVNRIEPHRHDAAAGSDKGSARGSGGRKAVLAAIEAVLLAQRVPEKQRSAVLAAATEKLAQRTRNGQSPKVKVYDREAPTQRPAAPAPEPKRSREQPAPTR